MENRGLLVGMTGQTGAGKTVVSKFLSSNGYRIIDADVVARQVVAEGQKCALDLAVEFGIEILNADGSLNRKRLGNIVFNDKKKRMRLNKITFPYIQDEIFGQVEELRQKGVDIIFLDAPTLIESGSHEQCDKVVSIIAPLELRLERIIARDNLTKEEAMARIRAQHGDEFYTSKSDFVIVNDGDMGQLRVKVLEMLDRIYPGHGTKASDQQED